VSESFSARLDAYIKQAGLPVRRIAQQAGVPHQTVYNWLKGTRPRWHPALTDDLRRLAIALGLVGTETDRLLQLAGCLSQRTIIAYTKDSNMKQTPHIPKGWFAAGSDPAEYEMGIDKGPEPARGGAAYIKAGERPQGFATLMQSFKADAYRGQRLRFSANVRALGIEQWAGLWMRVDGGSEQVLAFDNMQNRPITGTRDWETHHVVLDVPEHSNQVALGILLAGAGQVWMAEARTEPVGPDVPTTDTLADLPDHPENLSFEA
jgi:transcriptional regulator with XRE-family HTH domain